MGIAAGVHSKILAEKFIIQQVENAFSRKKTCPELGELLDTAISNAKALRDAYNFYTDLDYNDIAIKLFLATPAPVNHRNVIVLVGGGMLAQSMEHSFQEKMDIDIIMVTRQRKKLKKKINSKVTVMSVDQLNQNPLQYPYKCIVATSNLTDEYVSKLKEVFANKYCGEIFDFSAVPYFYQIKKKYVTIYGSEFNSIVKEGNQKQKDNSLKIQKEISEFIYTNQHKKLNEITEFAWKKSFS